MKIAIQGHPVRWKEVIQILKNLGGNDTYVTFGYNPNSYYYINVNNNITYIPTSKLKCSEYKDFKLYTLEEFEKEFPFKVGDKVLHKALKDYFEIIKFDPSYDYPYQIKGKEVFNCKSEALEFYKEMKTRTINLSLDKAKEWYKKGGELREIALQAFSEKELNLLPKSWEEFCNNYPRKDGESYVSNCCNIITLSGADRDRDSEVDKNICPSEKSAEAHLAMIQLEQLRDCWRQGWKPTNDDTGYCIIHYPTEYSIMSFCFINFLSFPTREIAKEFLKCFRDLIEKARDLI